MATRDLIYTDYFPTALTSQAGLAHLRINQKSIIFAVYCAGVAIECMLELTSEDMLNCTFKGKFY